MGEAKSWSSGTFEGNRLRQQRAFAALSFREQLECVEAMGELARRLRAPAAGDGAPPRSPPPDAVGGRTTARP
jgi:hypothetical protein